MKILFICTSIDAYLSEQVKALQKSGYKVDILNILEYKIIFDSGKKIHIRPKTKFKILEHFFILDEVNEQIRRKEIFNYLDSYDIVRIYKCEHYASEFKEKIESICIKYTITPNNILPRKSSKIEDLYKDSKLFVFENDRLRQAFEHIYGYEDRTITLKQPIQMLDIYDNIDSKVLDEFISYLNLSTNKYNIFCHFSGSIHKQKDLIISLANLPIEIKNISTFLLYLDNDDKIFNKNLLLLLNNIKLDYVVINKNSTDEQLAMLLKVSKASIFIDHSPFNSILITSIYAKNHPFIFQAREIEPFFKRNKIFLDDFREFYYMFEKDEVNESLLKEVLKQSQSRVYELFSYRSFSKRYIDATLK